MRLEIFPDPMALAHGAAIRLTSLAAEAIRQRGRFALALSGGSTPWAMLGVLATQDVDWAHVHLFQVDERRAPDGDETRNWTHIRHHLVDHVPIPAANLHEMPVLATPDAGAQDYVGELARISGRPPQLDCVQLGLGDDGHTASLVPDDAVLDVADRDVAWTAGPYQGTPRMTLTFPILNRARCILWLISGTRKAKIVARVRRGDPHIPAGRIASARAELFVDRDASTALHG